MEKLVKIEKHNESGYVVSSRVIAKELGKRHDNVLRDIENILISSNLRKSKSQSTEISVDLKKVIFSNIYKDSKNRNYKEYLLTKDGFILYMFNIQGHIDFKMAYINEFNRMEKELKQLKLTEKEKFTVFNPKLYLPISATDEWNAMKKMNEELVELRKDIYNKMKKLHCSVIELSTKVQKALDMADGIEFAMNRIEKEKTTALIEK